MPGVVHEYDGHGVALYSPTPHAGLFDVKSFCDVPCTSVVKMSRPEKTPEMGKAEEPAMAFYALRITLHADLFGVFGVLCAELIFCLSPFSLLFLASSVVKRI